MGERFYPIIGGVFLPSKTGGQEDRGSQATLGTYPSLLWASPDRCAHMDQTASPSHPHFSRWGNGGCQGPLPTSEGEAGGAGMWPPHWLLNGEGGRGVPIRGVLLRRFPAGETGNSLCASQLVWPCRALLCCIFGRLFKYSSSLSSLVHSPAHTATPPKVTTKRDKKEGPNYKHLNHFYLKSKWSLQVTDPFQTHHSL